MAGRTLADVWVAVRPDTSKTGPELEQGLARIDTTTAGEKSGNNFATGFGKSFRRIAVAGAAAFTGLQLGKQASDAVQSASDLAETGNKITQVFGPAEAKVNAFAAASVKGLGQSERSAKDASATFGIFGKSAGLQGDALAGFSTGLVTLSSDMASFSNTSPEEAIEAIGAALRGEAEPIRKYGVLLDDATLRNRALKLGLIATTKEALTPQQKVLAAQAEIMAQTGAAQGDFARTSSGLANQQRITSASMEQLRVKIGNGLLPLFLQGSQVLNTTLLPALSDAADKYMPAFTAKMSELITRGPEFLDTAKRIGAGIRGAFDFAKSGDITGDFLSALGLEEDDPRVAQMVKVRDIVVDALDSIKTTAREFFASISAADLTPLTQTFAKMGPLVKDASSSLPAVNSALDTTGTVFRFIGEHIDLVVKAMPYLLAAFGAYKVLQTANNVVGKESLIGFAAQIVSTAALTTANFALAASNRAAAAGAVQANAAESVSLLTRLRSTAATVAHVVATKSVQAATLIWTGIQWALNAAMLANPIGIVIIAIVALVAAIVLAYKNSETFRNIVDKCWEGIQAAASFAWNTVLKPILAFLVEHVGYAWQAFITFKDTVADVWTRANDLVRAGVRGVVLLMLDMAGKVLEAAATAFGWVPGIGDKLREAQGAFSKFRDDVNKSLGGIDDEAVKITAEMVATELRRGQSAIATGNFIGMATGGPIPGYGGGDRHVRALEGGEHVWSKDEVAAFGGQNAMLAYRKWVKATGGPGFDVQTRFRDPAFFATEGRAFVDRQKGELQADAAKLYAKELKASTPVMGAPQVGRNGWTFPLRGGYSIGMPLNGYPGHTGQDYPTPTGTPVVAPYSGFFSPKSLGNRSYGNYFDLTAGSTLFRAAHLQGFARAAGLVQQGELLGYAGSTGNSTGPHLHAEVREGGAIQNPRSYFGGGGETAVESEPMRLHRDDLDYIVSGFVRGVDASKARTGQALNAGVKR